MSQPFVIAGSERFAEAFSGLRTGGSGAVRSGFGDCPMFLRATRPPSFSQRSMARLKSDGDSAFISRGTRFEFRRRRLQVSPHAFTIARIGRRSTKKVLALHLFPGNLSSS